MELHSYSIDEIKRDCLFCPAYDSCIYAIFDGVQVKCIFFGQLEKEMRGTVDKWNLI